MNDFYNQDLAYIHQVGFDQFSKNAGAELIKIFKKNGIDSGLVIDLGCGTGHWANILLDEGYSVFGIDISVEMIRLARETAPRGEFLAASIYDVELRRCAAVTSLGEVMNYCAGGEPTLNRVEKLIQKITASLHKGGIFAFDMIVEPENEAMQYRTWNKGADWTVLTEVSETPSKNELIREITIFRKMSEQYRRTGETHRVRTLNREKIIRLLEKNGFAVSTSVSYGNYPLAPRRLAFVATKT